MPRDPLPCGGLSSIDLAVPVRLPDWVPSAVRLYLAHTEQGRSLREIARDEGVHASTVLRQVRRFENRRDDPLIEHALGRMRRDDGRQADAAPPPDATASVAPPQTPPPDAGLPADEARLLKAAGQFLPLLAQQDTLLAVAADMEKAVILRETAAGSQRLAVLDRAHAEAFALRAWITCRKSGRVSQYELAPEGRACLRKLGESRRGCGRDPAQSEDNEGRFRPAPESPVAILARRRDREGQPFLSPDMVTAAERLREDFEIAQMGSGTAMDWDRLQTGRVDGGARGTGLPGATPTAARSRVTAALGELGPGLGDIALRCCCWQEGVETAEQKLGWSARSGKIVLRIALQRLSRHYAELGDAGKMIG